MGAARATGGRPAPRRHAEAGARAESPRRGRAGRALAPLAVLAALLCAAAPTPAHAQPAVESRLPTDGVGRLIDDVAGEGDASSSEVNPALLSATRGLDLVVLGVRAVSDYARGEGFGVWGSIAPGFGFALGFGVQSLRPGLRAASDFDRAANPALTKLSFAASFGDGRKAAVGVATHPILVDGQRVRGADLDVGFVARLTNFASLGARARFAPASLEADALPATVSVLGELALRPLGRRNVELAAGVRSDFIDREFAGTRPELDALGLLPRFRGALRWQGWGLLGQVEQVRVTELDPATLAPRSACPSSGCGAGPWRSRPPGTSSACAAGSAPAPPMTRSTPSRCAGG